ncbi:MAG: HAD-IIB family hydrolase [Pelagibacteraceae bacterium TMED247]|mgnify:CR=1 FL=1|nr:MAG: HAD-IIB family hydrolase [Pelagibacteraceae bacterium TMED247]|tara:strand:+ start:1152 stop:2015 length:864 start_codon:yes stop_codon:yes gene_type:complete
MSYGKRMAWLKKQEEQEYYDHENVVLFDMDGTLTPPREAFDLSLLTPLRDLSKVATIGIVSGSNYDYILEQMNFLIRKSEIVYNLHLLPCNGTKWYQPPIHNISDFDLVHENNMIDALGVKVYKKLVSILLKLQCVITESDLDIPLTGEFIQYRGPMVNWCPIGRTAGQEDRKKFIKIDKKTNLRVEYMKKLQRSLVLHGYDKHVTCSFGGDTSFDIYPNGWDKTYALQHFPDKTIWFVGDRCEENGNDKTIYDVLQKHDRSYKTESIDQTREIISEIIQNIKMETV